MKKFDAFFASNKTFKVSFIVALILLAAVIVLSFVGGSIPGVGNVNGNSIWIFCILLVMIIVFFVSAAKHSDRTMTSVMGALFMALILIALLPFVNMMTNNNPMNGGFVAAAVQVGEEGGLGNQLPTDDLEMPDVNDNERPALTDGEQPALTDDEMPAMQNDGPGQQGAPDNAGEFFVMIGSVAVSGVSLVYGAISLFMFILYCMLFASHLAIHANKEYVITKVRFNQIVAIIIFIASVAAFIIQICTAGTFSLSTLSIWLINFALIFVLNMLVCVESKLGVYKQVRYISQEEGTWTEEKKEETKKELFGE